MIRVYCNKLENGNLEITQDMLTDILSYMKRQDKRINKAIEKVEEYSRDDFFKKYFGQFMLEILRGDKDVSFEEF